MFRFRGPGLEPSVLSPAFGANFSLDGGRAQSQGKASLWRELRDTRFRHLLLGPKKRGPKTAVRCLPAFSFPPFLSTWSFPTFLPQLLRFPFPGSCALRRDPESKASRSYPERRRVSGPQHRECIWGS